MQGRPHSRLERKRAEEQAKNSHEAARLEKERVDLLARNEELRKASINHARPARQTKAAEEKRVAALNAAEAATKAAEETIAKKRDAERRAATPQSSRHCLNLSSRSTLGGARQFDGGWTFTWRNDGPPCKGPTNGTRQVKIANGGCAPVSGTISASGEFRATTNSPSGKTIQWSGVLRKNSGSGTRRSWDCTGRWSAKRN